jgi:gamma-glutamylcyclotransferase (GGCT)/AIG2-like uncharacterized protein YtfP
MHVFTYGTLMFPEVWRAVVGQDFAKVGGTVSGFAIYRFRDAIYPGIIATSENDVVRGVVHLDVDEESLQRLDLFEDTNYERQLLTVTCDDGERREAAAYVVPTRNKSVLIDDSWDRDEFVASGNLDRFIRRFVGWSGVPPTDRETTD